MRYLVLVIAGVLALPLVPPTADAQSSLLRRGVRIRISCPQLAMQDRIVGVVAAKPDTLLVEHLQPTMSRGRVQEETVLSAVSIAGITKLEVSQGRRSNRDRGALMGGLIGSGAGLMLGITAAGFDYGGWWDPGAEVIPATMLAGAAWGAVVGLVVGSFSQRDDWQEVPLESLRVGIAAGSADRFEIGASLRF